MVNRLRRLLRRRLPILLGVVIVGTIGAAWATDFLNDQIGPVHSATATVFLETGAGAAGDGRTSTEAPPSLTAALDAATDANEGFLDANHGIRAQNSTQAIEFTVSAPTPEEAVNDASDMRNRYLVATALPPLEERMTEVLAKANFVREELNSLSPPEVVTVLDPTTTSQRALLSGQIQSLNSESAKLAVELVPADTESAKAAIQEDLDRILGEIVALRTQLETLPVDPASEEGRAAEAAAGRNEEQVVPPSNLDLNDQFQIESLQSLYSSLLLEFQSLYIRGIDAEPEILPEIEVTDETREPIAVALGAGIGLAVALLLVLSAVVVVDRLRPRWWTQKEMPFPIAETPARAKGTPETWYWNSGASPRKRAVQRIAVSLLPSIEAGPVALGVVGAGVKPDVVRGLSLDLAATVVTSGRRSLVIDTTGLEHPGKGKNAPADWTGPTVVELLNPWQGDVDEARVENTVRNAKRLWPGLSAIGSGSPSLYSVEGSMTPAVGKLVDTSRRSYALTLVGIVDQGSALTDAFARRLDGALVVGRAGSTFLKDAEALAERLTASGTPVLGSVLVVRPTRRKLREVVAGWRRRETAAAPAQPEVQRPLEAVSASASIPTSNGHSEESVTANGKEVAAPKPTARRPSKRTSEERVAAETEETSVTSS